MQALQLLAWSSDSSLLVGIVRTTRKVVMEEGQYGPDRRIAMGRGRKCVCDPGPDWLCPDGEGVP